MSAAAEHVAGRGLRRWVAIGAVAAALGLLLWARLIITAQLPREAIAEDPPAASGVTGGAAERGGEGP